MSYLISSCKGGMASSTRSSISVMKPLDKMGHEILKMGMQASGLNEATKGDIIDNVRIKRLRYRNLCGNTNMCLDKVHYCQEELAPVRDALDGIRKTLNAHYDKSRAERMKRLMNHDFLIVELLTGDKSEPKIFIRAEKIGFPAEEAGIHINFCNEYFGRYAKDVTLYTIDCKQKKVGLEKVMEVLEAEDPDYSVSEHNCWEYARKTTKLLLVACKGSVSGKQEDEEQKQERMRLQEEIDDLEARLSLEHLKNSGKRLLRGVQMPLEGIFNSSSATSVAGTNQAVQTTKVAVATAAYAVATNLNTALPPKAGDGQDMAAVGSVVVAEAVEDTYV